MLCLFLIWRFLDHLTYVCVPENFEYEGGHEQDKLQSKVLGNRNLETTY